MKTFYPLKSLLLSIIIFISAYQIQAQKFWLTTYEFPNGPKTGITSLDDNNLLASYRFGILQSKNGGNHFEVVLRASSVFSIYSTSSGNIFAGGPGKIFRSLNQGLSWDSVKLNSIYPVQQIAENPQGHLFAITGALNLESGYVGDGVFFSDDQGKTWSPRNSGLGNYKSCERIACDKNGTVYLTVTDEYVSGNGGLFVSRDNGLSWQHIDIQIDGKNSISNQIKVANTTGLTVTPDDSLIVSLSGIAVNTLVQLNVKKKITAISDNSFWKPYNITNTNTWWYDRLMGNVYFAKNGDRYSSVAGSVSQGGTYFQKKGKNTWQRYDYGLGLDMNGERNFQYFAENSTGRVFMIQRLDERIYWTDESITTSSPDPNKSQDFTVFPNPAQPGSTVTLLSDKNLSGYQITIYDSTGKVVHTVEKTFQNPTVISPSTPGIYIIVARKQQEQIIFRLVVSPSQN
jgi:hypothetical protein